MQVYTVVGFYLDNKQPFIDWVKAKTPQDACRKAKERRAGSATGVVDVFLGKHQGCLLNEIII